MKSAIHPRAEVQTTKVGENTQIWQHTVVLAGASIGKDVNINAHCFVENDVVIGDRVTVKSGVYLWDGIRLGDDVFVGPNVTFTNDKHPRSKKRLEKFLVTVVEKNASIGAGAVILPGITIGQYAMVGAGAVVTQSVPPYAIVVGTPARIIGYIENSDHEMTEQAIAPDLGGAPVSVGVGGVTLHPLKLVKDMRGDLSVGEFMRDIPFVPKRYFLVFNVPSEKTRGEHAHYQCEQFLVCVKGSCAVVVDDGHCRKEILLDSPQRGLYLPPMTWGIQYKYSADAVLLVYASDYYDANDYIRDYSKFVAEISRAQ